MKNFVTIVLIFVLQFNLRAQSWGIGASAMYNFQTESFGPGIRVEIPISGGLSLVPQFSYYPAFNKINEYYLTLALHQNLFHLGNWTFYAILNGGYNGWINYKESFIDHAKYSNWDLEGGAGIKLNRCLRPFIEYRYNIKWKETNLHLGLMYFFKCKNNKRFGAGGGRGGARSRKGTCNAYD